jgi:hypothetical protein
MRRPSLTWSGRLAIPKRFSLHGYVTEYVSWVLNRQEFLSHVEGLGMTLIREILVGEGPAVHGVPEPCEFNSFLFAHAASLMNADVPCRLNGSRMGEAVNPPKIRP